MFETRRQITYGPRDVGIDGVSLAARWRRVMGLVQNEQGSWAEGAEPVAKRSGVGLVNQEALRNQKARVGRPRVDPEAALAAHTLYVVLIQDFKPQAEPGIEFVPPLEQHGRRAGHDDFSNFLAEKKLAGDETCLDGLAQANILGSS